MAPRRGFELTTGSVFGERYKVVQRLGAGSEGEVYQIAERSTGVHRAAKLFTDLELTRSCVLAALDALDRGDKRVAEYASLAKARASETVHLATNEFVQMHGGIGMTDAHDSGLYMKRARVAEALYGGASFHRRAEMHQLAVEA